MKQMKFTTQRQPGSIVAERGVRALAAAMAIAALTLAAGLSRPAYAADDPMAVVKATVDPALQILRDKQTPLGDRQDHLRKIVAASFDFKETARSAMGYHWRNLTPQQQDEFTQDFVAFIEDAYLSRISEYRDQNVAFLSARNQSPD